MNPLDSFTVERLDDLVSYSIDKEVASLAKIALAAKQAKPVASFILIDGEYHQLAEVFRESPDAIPLYEEPPVAKLPDGWIKCSERMPGIDDCYYLGYSIAGACEVYFEGRCFIDERVTHWMPLPAAPKPE